MRNVSKIPPNIATKEQVVVPRNAPPRVVAVGAEAARGARLAEKFQRVRHTKYPGAICDATPRWHPGAPAIARRSPQATNLRKRSGD